MAKGCTFSALTDLSSSQIDSVRKPNPLSGLTSRQTLAQHLHIDESRDPRNAVLMDLFVHAMQYANELKMTNEKMAGLVSLVKLVHERSCESKMPLDASFTFFKEALLQNSLHRPPYSFGLFTLQEAKEISSWMLDTYYRHYKLYQYAFTNRVTMDVTSLGACHDICVAAVLPPLEEAIDEAKHEALVAQHARQRAEEEAIAQAAHAALIEEERLRKIREEYEASIPDEIQQQVKEAVDRELARLRQQLASQPVGQ